MFSPSHLLLWSISCYISFIFLLQFLALTYNSALSCCFSRRSDVLRSRRSRFCSISIPLKSCPRCCSIFLFCILLQQFTKDKTVLIYLLLIWHLLQWFLFLNIMYYWTVQLFLSRSSDCFPAAATFNSGSWKTFICSLKICPCFTLPVLRSQSIDALGEASACHSDVHLQCLTVFYWPNERIKGEGINKTAWGWMKAWVGTKHVNLTDGVQADLVF